MQPSATLKHVAQVAPGCLHATCSESATNVQYFEAVLVFYHILNILHMLHVAIYCTINHKIECGRCATPIELKVKGKPVDSFF